MAQAPGLTQVENAEGDGVTPEPSCSVQPGQRQLSPQPQAEGKAAVAPDSDLDPEVGIQVVVAAAWRA